MVHDEWRNRGISWFLSYLVCHVCRNTEHCPPFTPHRRQDGFRGTLANVARIVHRAMSFTGMYSFGLVRGSRAGKSRKSYQNTGLLRPTSLCCSLQVLFQVQTVVSKSRQNSLIQYKLIAVRNSYSNTLVCRIAVHERASRLCVA